MADRDLADLQRQSLWLRRALTVLMVLLGAAILLVWFNPLWTYGRPDRPPQSEIPEGVVGGFVWWGPALFYYWALWAVRRALGDIAAGRLFQPAIARSLRDVGAGLAGGAIMSAIVQPNLMRVLNETGARYPWAGWAHFDVAYFAVGTVGLALILLSRVMKRAAEMQAELDQFI
jgi:hypothetical protein